MPLDLDAVRSESLERRRKWNYPTGVDAEDAIDALLAEVARLRAGCNPECPTCGLKPCNEDGKAVLYCDECYSALTNEVARLREENLLLRSELFGLRTDVATMLTPPSPPAAAAGRTDGSVRAVTG